MNGLYINRNINKKQGPLQSHFHNSLHEIYYLKRGSMRYIINDRIYELSKNCIALIPKGVIHNTVYGNVDTERLLITFDESLLASKDLLSVFGCGVISLSEKEGFELENIFKKLEYEISREDEFSKSLVIGYITELLISFKRKEITANTPSLDGYTGIMQSAVEYINKNYSQEISLDELSGKFSLSKSFFSRKFKEVTGFGLSEYITLVRIKAAEKMLKNGNGSITDIAFACGFNDSSYFSATFKRLMGITPLKYAKKKH